MPSGKNHDLITWLCLPFVLTTFLLLTKRSDLALLASIAFIFSGLMFGPDLDIYSIQYQRWRFFQSIWLPYQKSLKHRSFFSHGFMIGTIIRVFYLGLILFILAIFLVAIAQLIFGFGWHWQNFMVNSYKVIKNEYWREVLSFFIGLELGAMSHSVADNIDSWLKSGRKKVNKSKAIDSRRQKTVGQNAKKVNNKTRKRN